MDKKLKLSLLSHIRGEPIRVSGAVRNRNGYRYGCEFIPDGQVERNHVARSRQVLQTLAGVKSC
jgi:hypothetical protein